LTKGTLSLARVAAYLISVWPSNPFSLVSGKKSRKSSPSDINKTACFINPEPEFINMRSD
jgi:hypothetical protein